MSYETALSETVTLPVAGIIDIDGAAKQIFSTPTAAWGFQIYIGGELVWDFGGIAIQDIVPLCAWKYCPAGSCTIEVKWAGDSTITLGARFLKVRHYKKTSGS